MRVGFVFLYGPAICNSAADGERRVGKAIPHIRGDGEGLGLLVEKAVDAAAYPNLCLCGEGGCDDKGEKEKKLLVRSKSADIRKRKIYSERRT